ncbi:uncharacterized protein CTRU02_214852 [Colletotrichum truncatum]|uniref:Uncharacterized protein n=1 Tax=Colletotrichum truncatum TaxID=5467 RepID=A0ACC3YEP1_COLTU|nr:uncharacterized protein CTRU02_08393 [Colletotrichum truncatum]KAF6790264.1 hypothetical protein CTRU02_08393 [Colletotrichum truncatum]
MNSPTCSCQFDDTIRNLNLPYYEQEHHGGLLGLEEIVRLDWRFSNLIRTTRDCECCFADLNILIATQSTLETVLSLLETAQSTYGSRINRRRRQSSEQSMDELLNRWPIGNGGEMKGNGFVLGRVVLGEEDCDVMARRLIISAISRMARCVRELRARITRYMDNYCRTSQSASQYYNLPRHAKEAYDELDDKLGTILARVCAAVARERI